jgi:outer membrane immunogenic protein
MLRYCCCYLARQLLLPIQAFCLQLVAAQCRKEGLMRKLSGLVGASLLFAGPACAADLPVKAPVMPLAPVLGWTGFYIGGNVGYGWSDQAVNFSGDPHLGTLIANGLVASSLASRPSGAIGGVQAGYNWQTGPVVLGIETDIDASGIAKSASLTVPGTTTRPDWFTSADQQLNFLGTVRGRLGFTITPSLLAYGTGGFAYGGANVSSTVTSSTHGSATTNCQNFCGNSFGSSPTLTGWAAGGGLEYMVTPNWSLKAEYLYFDLGTLTQTYGDTTGRPLGTVSTGTEFKGSIARIGANYKF